MPALGWEYALKRGGAVGWYSGWVPAHTVCVGKRSPLCAGFPSCTSRRIQSLLRNGVAWQQKVVRDGTPRTTCTRVLTHSHFGSSRPRGPREKMQHFAAVIAVRGRTQRLIRGLRYPYASALIHSCRS